MESQVDLSLDLSPGRLGLDAAAPAAGVGPG